jgi:E3 ubiquitin-protein ligase UBR2
MAEIIEPPLRIQVMVAQTQAGMWRRNGYSLLNQVI